MLGGMSNRGRASPELIQEMGTPAAETRNASLRPSRHSGGRTRNAHQAGYQG